MSTEKKGKLENKMIVLGYLGQTITIFKNGDVMMSKFSQNISSEDFNTVIKIRDEFVKS